MEPFNHFTNISPREFEEWVKECLEESGRGLAELVVTHDVKLAGHDGSYQIDVFVTFKVLGGVEIKVLVECKYYNKRVQRDDVMLLKSKLQSLGAHKGMLFSNAGFQSGARDFAEAHGIALISVMEGKFTYHTRSLNGYDSIPPPWVNVPKYVGVYHYNQTETSSKIAFLEKGKMEPLVDFIFGK